MCWRPCLLRYCNLTSGNFVGGCAVCPCRGSLGRGGGPFWYSMVEREQLALQRCDHCLAALCKGEQPYLDEAQKKLGDEAPQQAEVVADRSQDGVDGIAQIWLFGLAQRPQAIPAILQG